MKRMKKVSALLLITLMAFLFSITVFAATFPENGPFNGMQITYSISGVSIENTTDQESFTTSRTMTGKVTDGTVTISGTVKMEGGYGADISAGCGNNSYSKKINAGESDSFSLSIPVKKSDRSIYVSVRMTGSYNAGTRGLMVCGTFENPNYVDPYAEKADTDPKSDSSSSVSPSADKKKKNIKINTTASDSEGERGASVPAIIVVGLLGTAAAATATAGTSAGTGGSSDSSEEQQDDGKSYKMYVYKDFGDSIRLDAPGVPVYARMAEISKEGIENERLDLTQQIEIFPGSSAIKVRDQAPSGNYVGAFVEAESSGGEKPKEGIVSFKFTGEGGTFQNNVSFWLVGECYIELPEQNLFILSGSGNSFDMAYNLVDFTSEADVKVNIMQNNAPFTLETGVDRNNQTIIIAMDNGEKRQFDSFFESFTCEITAENDKESARTVFDVVVCHEGILPDFLGKPKEIRGYRKDPESEEMEETLFYIRAGVWNDENQKLEFVRPENVSISLEDEKNIFGLIGMDITEEPEKSPDDAIAYIAKADKCFPSNGPIEGIMTISGNYGVVSLENEVKIQLIPDIQKYEEDFEKEYQACKRVINVYMAERLRERKLCELEKAKNNLGLKDLKLFRKNCWDIAERCIMQDAQEYMIDEAWYDEAIATAEFIVYIGDVAFDIALAPIGGPITGFLAGQVKSSFLELCQLYVKGAGDKSVWDITTEFVQSRLVQSLGSADGLIATPGLDKPAALAVWLTCYTIYRIGYHWYFDKDEEGRSIGIQDSLWKGLQDFAGKGAGALLGEFVKNSAKGTWAEKISIADKDQKLVDDKVRKVVESGLDTFDAAAKKADKAVDEFVDTLYQYLQKLKTGEYVPPNIR